MAEDIKTPKVSVVMAVYNGGDYLHSAIDGVLAQTLKDFEFIIVDDGSADGSRSVIEEYAKKDNRIRQIINKTNQGLVYSLNRGVEAAKSQYIARHDADDISLPDRFEKEYDYLEAHPDVVVIGSAYIEIDDAGKKLQATAMPTTDEEIRLTMYFAHVFAHGSVMMRRDVLEKAGCYRAEYWPGEDLDLWRRMAAFGKLANLAEPLYKYRMNEQGISLSNLKRQQDKIRKIHEELRRNPKLLFASKSFLATIKTASPDAYLEARQQTKALSQQMLKRRRFANARFLSAALRMNSPTKPRVLMVSPTKWLGGGEVYTEMVIRGLANTYTFYLWSGQKLRRRIGGVSKNLGVPLFPFSVKQLLKRTRPLEELYYRGLSVTRIRFSDLNLINIQAYEPAVLKSLTKQKKVPVVFTAHTRFPMRQPAECEFVRKTLEDVARIVCVSEAAKQDLRQIGIPENQCEVIHNGVDTERFVPAPEPGQCITWIGRIEDNLKNPMLFVDIARMAKKAGSLLRFRMVGEGTLVPQIRDIIEKEHLDSLELTGFVQDTPKIYAQASVLCLTSTSESLPLVILEAMSAGVPVVSTDVGGVKEIISSKELGTVLNSPKPEDFYKAIEHTLSSKGGYDQLRARVREHIVQNFSQSQMLAQTQKLFDRVIAGLK